MRPGILAAMGLVGMLVATACSSSSSGGSGGGSTCDAGACAAIAGEIVAHGGTSGTCNEPEPQYEAACQSYAACLKQCGQ